MSVNALLKVITMNKYYFRDWDITKVNKSELLLNGKGYNLIVIGSDHGIFELYSILNPFTSIFKFRSYQQFSYFLKNLKKQPICQSIITIKTMKFVQLYYEFKAQWMFKSVVPLKYYKMVVYSNIILSAVFLFDNIKEDEILNMRYQVFNLAQICLDKAVSINWKNESDWKMERNKFNYIRYIGSSKLVENFVDALTLSYLLNMDEISEFIYLRHLFINAFNLRPTFKLTESWFFTSYFIINNEVHPVSNENVTRFKNDLENNNYFLNAGPYDPLNLYDNILNSQ